MNIECSEQSDKSWKFVASVAGQGISRSMQAVAGSNNPTRFFYPLIRPSISQTAQYSATSQGRNQA